MKTNILIVFGIITLLLGCANNKLVKREVIHTACPRFLYKINITFKDYNSTYALVSKKDVKKIIQLSKEKKQFNSYVQDLNKKSWNNMFNK